MNLLLKSLTLLALLALPEIAAQSAEVNSNVLSVLNWTPADTQSISSTTLQGFDDPDLSPLNSGALWLVILLRPFWPICDEVGDPKSFECIECVTAPTKDRDKENQCCDFLFLGEDPKGDAKLQAFLSKNASITYQDCGLTVVQLKQLGKTSEASSYRYCFAKAGLVIGCTRKELMHATLLRIKSDTTHRAALPDTLPEWSYVDTKAPCWGLRHFADYDKTSPASPASESKGKPIDKKAIGMTFSYSLKDKIVNFTYLSRSKSLQAKAEQICGITAKNLAQVISSEQSITNTISLKLKSKDKNAPHEILTSITRWLGWIPTQD